MVVTGLQLPKMRYKLLLEIWKNMDNKFLFVGLFLAGMIVLPTLFVIAVLEIIR